MRGKGILTFYLGVMFVLLVWGLFFSKSLTSLLAKPEHYLQVKFIHVISVSLFFANTVIGSFWELRSLRTGKLEIVRYTYETVIWLDAIFTAPLIISSVMSGIMLGTILGGVWTMGWLSLAFLLFLATGAVWICFDIPSQYRINKALSELPKDDNELPLHLKKMFKVRMGINLAGILPLLIIFYLMILKPEILVFIRPSGE